MSRGYALMELGEKYKAHDGLVTHGVLAENSQFINGSGDLVTRVFSEFGETPRCEPIVMGMLLYYDMRNAGYQFTERVKY